MAMTVAVTWLPSTASRGRTLAAPLPPFAGPISIHMPLRAPPPIPFPTSRASPSPPHSSISPEGSVPRPIARIGVAVAAVSVALFLLKSIVSTALFVLAMMGLIYLGFLAMNPKEASDSRLDEATGDPSEDQIEEARRIMEKYK
ncbi:hypothetical protein ZEAMMB73_Zm00001d006099 [Zea mays]|uniref:Uncharacterized protein n=1 Tax=Zea mays TaxID=4577 RepID=A0A1D6ESV4_MAIZE|nr:hypothetical protein ZEAMMB73_Zm00001d006099 [Zea mays]